MLIIFFRALVLYVLVVAFIRLMGKRQVGELQPYELVITLLIADLVATPMQNVGLPLIEGIIPLLSLLFMHNLIALLTYRFNWLRTLFCGKPSILIEDGLINTKEMEKLNMSVVELMEHLRVRQVGNIQDVHRAILETNGQISLILRREASPPTARELGMKTQEQAIQITVIEKGRVNRAHLAMLRVSETALKAALCALGIDSEKTVYAALMDTNGMLTVQKQNAQETKQIQIKVTA
ncbi:MAG: DUF421 domain-containing protein [Clostridia bacterium]|nr:DUF421 domain-containing protein [Clostridia bacterium]